MDGSIDFFTSETRDAVAELMKERGFIPSRRVMRNSYETPKLQELAPPIRRHQSQSQGKTKVAPDDMTPAQKFSGGRTSMQEGAPNSGGRKFAPSDTDRKVEVLREQKIREGQQEIAMRYAKLTQKLNDLGIFDSLTNQARAFPPHFVSRSKPVHRLKLAVPVLRVEPEQCALRHWYERYLPPL